MSNIIDAIRARMIEDCGRWHKFWSVRLAAGGALIEAFLHWFPDSATAVWNALPEDMRALLPGWLTSSLPIILFVAIAIARMIPQKPKGPTDG